MHSMVRCLHLHLPSNKSASPQLLCSARTRFMNSSNIENIKTHAHALSICNFSGLQSVAFKGVFDCVEDLRMLAQITSRRCRCDGGIKEGEKSDLYAVPSYSHRSRDISNIMSVYIKLFPCYCIHHLHVPGSVYVQHARTGSDMFPCV